MPNPFGLRLSFDKLRTIGTHPPFALSLSFDKLKMIGTHPPFGLSLSKPFPTTIA